MKDPVPLTPRTLGASLGTGPGGTGPPAAGRLPGRRTLGG
jgi:hypothetical protein